jgi:hypothetical protein
MESPVLTAKEAMAFLKRGRTWLTEHADEIGCVRKNGLLYFYVRDLEAWLARDYRPPTHAQARQSTWSVLVSGTAINPLTGLPYGTPLEPSA